MQYDYLIVGSGLFGSTFANLANADSKKCLIIEKREHPFGNCYTEKQNEIDVHKYGPHIFHTNSSKIWQYVNKFSKFNNYINSPKVNYGDTLYSFPINLMTLQQLWGVTTPKEASDKLEKEKLNITKPTNLEEWILSQVGEEIYYTFIYGYTKKQWGTEPKNLPTFIIRRLPIRLNFNDNYYFDKYQGIPENGYSNMMSNMIGKTEIVLNTDYFAKRDYWDSLAKKVVYTGAIDDFFNQEYGTLDYRSLKFEHKVLTNTLDYQGNAIINYTDFSIPYTRIIEHKHFNFGQQKDTIITKEYPQSFNQNTDKYYPINNKINNELYDRYKNKTNNLSSKYLFGGRLAEYKYYDMHQIIGSAMSKYEK